MYDNRSNGRVYRNAMGGIIAGIFIICLAVAIFLGGLQCELVFTHLVFGSGTRFADRLYYRI